MGQTVFRTIALVAFIALAACSRANDGSKNAAPGGASPDKSKQEDKPVAKPALEASYDLQGYEQCSTGPKTVSAATHEEFAKKFCALLQSGKENNSCAESERLELFIVNCEGPWHPTDAGSRVGLKKRGESRVNDGRGHEMEISIQHLEVLPPQAPADIQTQTIYNRLSRCGLTPTCLLSLDMTGGEPAMSIVWSSVEWKPENQIALIGAINQATVSSGLTVVDPSAPVTYIVFRFPKSTTQAAPRIEVWTGLYPIGFRSFREFFSHAASTHLVTTLQTQYN